MDLPTVEEMVARLTALRASATPEQVQAGQRWYQDARALAVELANTCGLSIEQAAGVMAALSPREHWQRLYVRLVRWTQASQAGQPITSELTIGTGSNQYKAQQILAGAPIGAQCSGPKVLAFYRAILGDEQAVPIDCHAHRAAIGRNAPELLQRKGHRQDVQDAYTAVARQFGETPRECQAIIWLVQQTRSAGSGTNGNGRVLQFAA